MSMVCPCYVVVVSFTPLIWVALKGFLVSVNTTLISFWSWYSPFATLV